MSAQKLRVEVRAETLWRNNTRDQLRLFGGEWPAELTWDSEPAEFKDRWRIIAAKQLVEERKFSEAVDRGARALYELQETSWFRPKRRRWPVADVATRQRFRLLAEAVLKAAQEQ